MEALTNPPFLQSRHHTPNSPLLHAHFSKPNPSKRNHLISRTTTPPSSKFNLFTPSSVSLDHHNHVELKSVGDQEIHDGKFDWYSQWYPLMPECDLDKRVPHAKKVLGIDVVVWWDVKQNAWKVFDDMCPHRLAPLSEGRIDASGRLQCVYHGWCFDGSGNCKLIPQAPVEGPPVHTNKRACVTAYPTTLEYGIVWFWPNSDPQYKDIIERKKPPFIPELSDPSFTHALGVRDLPFGYDFLLENVMDPAHVPYAHYGLLPTTPPKGKKKLDREGGRPLDYSAKEVRVDGFVGEMETLDVEFVAPCLFTIHAGDNQAIHLWGEFEFVFVMQDQKRTGMVFLCIPVSPGYSRCIWALPRNFNLWVDRVVPRWVIHLGINLVFDSDLILIHFQERRIRGIGHWHKACFVPNTSDAVVIGFRKWFDRFSDGKVDWRGKYSGDLPPTLPREQLMDRYWTHVVNCRSCNSAYKTMNALKKILLFVSVGSIAVAAATKEAGTIPMLASLRTRAAMIATICFVASRWLARFVYTNFRYHDYDHGLVHHEPSTPFIALFRRIGLDL
ncbi:Protochlorophyllide-dependent translocon component 52, chloroplastic [Linum grandiflorum]